ncbi:MAG: acetyl-CoA carboxylase biotin carboxyl carrier protein subunit [Deltaproteobacteria bacterium]|nr:acetyl-CoA carboxylase biotin carboxyl carrier protein subunit [Deltaproteobacteria bacterium]
MKTEFQIAAETVVAEIERRDGAFSLNLSGREVKGEILRWEPPFFTIRHCDHILQGAFYRAVKKGDLLMMLEAMKMEHKILSPSDGTVKQVFFKEGERVAQDVELLEIASEAKK